jgi:hypothetical protein
LSKKASVPTASWNQLARSAASAQYLHQRHAEVGGIALGPVRHGRGHPVEHQLAETGPVAGQVVGGRSRSARRGDWRRFGAVESGRAFDLEREADLGELPVHIGGRVGVDRPLPEREAIGREVTGLIERQSQRLAVGLERRREDRDALDPRAAGQGEIVFGERRDTVGLEEGDVEQLLRHAGGRGAVEYLDEVDAVQFQPAALVVMGVEHALATQRGAAMTFASDHSVPSTTASRCSLSPRLL